MKSHKVEIEIKNRGGDTARFKEEKIKRILKYFNIASFDLQYIQSRAGYKKVFALEIPQTESRHYDRRFIGSVVLAIKGEVA